MRLLRVVLCLVIIAPLFAAPAAAGVGMTFWQFVTTADQNITLDDCNARAPRALAAAGLSQERHNGSDGSRFHVEWFGSSSGHSSVYISCYTSTANTTTVTIVVASIPNAAGSTEQSVVMQEIKDGFFGSATPPVTVPLPTLPLATPPPTAAVGGSGWAALAVPLRGHNGERFTFTCEPNGQLSSVWGSDVYTDDTTVCSAAVHAGLITVQSGGTVIIEIRPGQASYFGTDRNGVSSLNYTAWSGSYVFVGLPEAPPKLAPEHGPDASGTWNWSATCNDGSSYTGTFTIANLQSDGTFSGEFLQNGAVSVNGTIAGQLRSLAVTFTRRWPSGEQQWNGTLDQTGSTMTGNFSGPCGPGTFSASKQ